MTGPAARRAEEQQIAHAKRIEADQHDLANVRLLTRSTRKLHAMTTKDVAHEPRAVERARSCSTQTIARTNVARGSRRDLFDRSR